MKDYSSIVVESRIKLLRNLNGFDFPSMLSGDDGVKVLNKVADVVLKLDSDFKLYKVKTLPDLDVNIMREKNLITNRLIDANGYGAVVLSADESVNVMINESDHICICGDMKGLNLINIYNKLDDVDNQILSKLDIAYDDALGFMTSNILDAGTGMKANVVLFLPALSIAGKTREIAQSLSSQGFEFKPEMNEDLENQSYTYVLSNAETIGKKETELVVKVSEFAIKICEMEIRARSELLKAIHIDQIKDRIYRAWGVLTNCYLIDVGEALKLLGEIKMAVALDLIRFKEIDFIDKLMIDILPYSLTKISGSKVTIAELDKYRAKFLSNVLQVKRIK